MTDSHDFCLDFDNDSDTRVNHNFEYDSEQVAEEVTLIENTDDPIEITQTTLLRRTMDQRIDVVANVLQYLQACSQEAKVL